MDQVAEPLLWGVAQGESAPFSRHESHGEKGRCEQEGSKTQSHGDGSHPPGRALGASSQAQPDSEHTGREGKHAEEERWCHDDAQHTAAEGKTAERTNVGLRAVRVIPNTWLSGRRLAHLDMLGLYEDRWPVPNSVHEPSAHAAMNAVVTAHHHHDRPDGTITVTRRT